MDRHINREKAMICVYEFLVFERDPEELIEDTFECKKEEMEDTYFTDIIETSVKNRERFAGYIDEVLEGWTFDRLGFIEQAILLNGCSEFELKQLDAAIIIDEAVRMAKKFCDEDTYKLINSILEVI